MATKLLGQRVWPRLTKLARTTKQKCHVAVAYFGQGASKLLPLSAGSTLVVDMTERAVMEGQTCPTEIGKMLRRGVTVYSCVGLHAKVFVFGKRAFVGSANVSNRSKDYLIEAAIETREPGTVRSCTEFVKDHCREPITEEDVERLAPLYQPAGGSTGKPRAGGDLNGYRPLWAVALSRTDWDDEDTRQANKARPQAEKELGNNRQFKLDEFCWTGSDLKISERDMVVQVLTERKRRIFVHPPGKVVRIQQYHVGNSSRMIVFLKEPKKARRIALKRLVNQVEAPTEGLRKLKRARRLRNHKLVSELHRLWRLAINA
jgi:hypothetical protein